MLFQFKKHRAVIVSGWGIEEGPLYFVPTVVPQAPAVPAAFRPSRPKWFRRACFQWKSMLLSIGTGVLWYFCPCSGILTSCTCKCSKLECFSMSVQCGKGFCGSPITGGAFFCYACFFKVPVNGSGQCACYTKLVSNVDDFLECFVMTKGTWLQLSKKSRFNVRHATVSKVHPVVSSISGSLCRVCQSAERLT